jgi:hypothetical protein
MSIIIVTYDLNDLTRDYTPFFTAIQNQGVWWHNLRTTWLIDTTKTPAEVYEAVRHFITVNDRIFIGRLGDGYSGWLDSTAWPWIQSRIKQA